MQLLRFALLTFDKAPEGWREWVLKTDEAQIHAEWARELEGGKLTVFVVAAIDLSEKPKVNKDGLVIIPEGPLKRAETLIETLANLVAVSERCKRSISSPIPSVGFLPADEETRAWLDSTNGIFRSGRASLVSMQNPRIDLDTALKLSSDRPDGAALLAEALAHDHPTGKFHELLRVFERAFRLTSSALINPLASFLSGANMGYSRAEVERWLTTLRHPATHADKRPSFVLESDIRPVIPRMVQAAYDVLFNKEGWRDPSTQRREVWSPPAGTRGETFDLFIVRGTEATIEAQLFDEVGSYPMSIDSDINKAISPEIWTKWPSERKNSNNPQ